MVEKEPQNEQTKEINGVTITNLEISKIAMICDYLVLDRFNDISSFNRFEKCFGPLLNKEDPNFLIEVFQEICGPKKKYISFGRLISAYIKWKTNSSQNDNFNKFMNTVFNSMIKTQDEVIGKLEEGTRIFSTRNTRGRKVISKFSVFTDSSKNCIQGFNIQYDDFFDSLLCTKKKEGEDKNINLEINFPPNGKTILDRDGISHIAGKFSVTNNVVKFLIFKCRSGKTFFIGDNSEDDGEKIDLFMFGTSSCQLKTLRIETINDKLAYLEPKFQPSMRVNQKIISFDLIDEKYINEHIINSQLIFEENEIQNVPIENLDQKTLLIPCINDDAFMEKGSLEEKISGKDYHEVYKCYLVREKEEKEEKKDEEEKEKEGKKDEEEKEKEEKEKEEKEKEELKKSLVEKTVQRVSLLRFYSKKYKNKENLMVLKNKNINIQEEERVNMDKYLAKIKLFRKKVDNRKELGKKEEKENVEEELEQDEDWVDNEKKDEEEEKKEDEKVVEEIKEEEIKEEEKKEDEKVEEKKEDEKVEDKKEDEKVEDKKEDEKVEDKKEDEKVEEIKEEEKVEDKKEDEKVEEIKEDEKVEEIKEDEKVEDKKEDEKVEEIKEDEKVEEIKEDEKVEEKKEEEIKKEIKVEENKENENIIEEDKKEENNNIIIEENKEKIITEDNKITIESNDINEINVEENDKKEEKIRLRGKQPKRLKRKQQNENNEDKKEEKEEEKNEEKLNIKIEDKIEEKKEEKKEILEIKEQKDKIEDKKENDNNKLDNYESNKLEDIDEKKEKKEEKTEEVQPKKTFCASCIII